MKMGGSEYPGVAVVTGAASGELLLARTDVNQSSNIHLPGMGRAIAQTFAKLGCTNIALIDIDSKGLDATARLVHISLSQAKAHIHTQECDISNAESVSTAFAEIFNTFQRIDYLVNAAGIMVFNEPSTETSIESFDSVHSINYRGLWLCSRQALKIMTKQPLDCEAFPDAGIDPARAQRGSIVNISSVLGLQAMAGSPAYCAAKAGVLSLTRSDAVDYSPHRIRVNAVMPGLVDTPMTRPTKEIAEYWDVVAERQAPMRRKGSAQEIADVVLFLSGNKASFVQGAAWAVDGGNAAEKR
jgi:NAD(P)-dependent dehydrogenase (short-subunit alcohol dehydrogenase family)